MIIHDIEHFHFLRPYWLLALIVLLFLMWRLRTAFSSTENWKKICDAHLLPSLIMKKTAKKGRWSTVSLVIGFFIAIVALAGPTWKQLKQPIYRALDSRVIVLDLSPSMYANDIKPSRLMRAKFKVLDILNQSKENQVGMIVFSGEPFVVSPLTTDAQTIASMVSILSPTIMPLDGSNLTWALAEAGKLLKQAKVTKGTILLITADAGNEKAVKEATELYQKGYKISVLGIGTKEGAPIPIPTGGFLTNQQGGIEISKLNVNELKKIATAGGGKYVSFTATNQDINVLLASTDLEQVNKKLKKVKDMLMIWQDEGRWFVLLLLPLVLLVFRRGVL